ncbi:MAG: glycoside hydrolase family 25 protein [Lachnospiraceae bacterium]|nr:glycoside hydrolase family 25 protein [Lachnospiraceae bacterium]
MKKGWLAGVVLSLMLAFSLFGAYFGENCFFLAGELIETKAEELKENVETMFRILPQMLAEAFPPVEEPAEPEAPPEEPESEPQAEPLSPIYPVEKITYLDANRQKKEMITDPFAPRNNYDRELFTISHGFMSYGGPGYETRLGVDVSHHQGVIDWNRVASAGIRFAIIRIGYRGYSSSGKLYEDRMWKRNIEGAKAAGLDVGVYFFSQAVNTEEAAEEADFVLSLLDGEELTLPVVYDPESIKTAAARTDDVYGEQFTVNTRVFCDLIRNAGYAPMIYANMAWEDEKLDMAALSDVPFWFADYQSKPQSPYCFDFWQYTSHGRVSGIVSRVDMNIQMIPVEEGNAFGGN